VELKITKKMVLKHVDGEMELRITEEVVLKHVDGEWS
jgi:hypothetical protein